MMRLKPIYIVLLLAVILAGGLLLSGCSGNSDDSRNTVYEDMNASFDSAELLVFTVNTEMKTEEVPGANMDVLSPEVRR